MPAENVAIVPSDAVDAVVVSASARADHDGVWLDGASFSTAEPQGWEGFPIHQGAAIKVQFAALLSAALQPVGGAEDHDRLQASARKLKLDEDDEREQESESRTDLEHLQHWEPALLYQFNQCHVQLESAAVEQDSDNDVKGDVASSCGKQSQHCKRYMQPTKSALLKQKTRTPSQVVEPDMQRNHFDLT